jgi:hypothetical protein
MPKSRVLLIVVSVRRARLSLWYCWFSRRMPGKFRTRVITDGVVPSLHVDYKNSRIQSEKQGDLGEIWTVAKNRRCPTAVHADAPMCAQMKKGHRSKFGRKQEASIAAM